MVACDKCGSWVHASCDGITGREYLVLSAEDTPYSACETERERDGWTERESETEREREGETEREGGMDGEGKIQTLRADKKGLCMSRGERERESVCVCVCVCV